jgi:hypothetical protein
VIAHSRVHRANNFAGRNLAMHARHRLEGDIGRIDRPRIVPVDAQPMHDPTGEHLIFANHRHIVFGLARDRAGLAADARIQIYCHCPGVARVLEAGIK